MRDRAANSGGAVLALTVAVTLLVVDPAADAAFDAPKLLAGMVGIAVAALCVMATGDPAGRTAAPRGVARTLLAMGALAAVFVAVAACTAPRRLLAIETARRMVLFGAALSVGASRVLDQGRSQWIVAAFLAAAAFNAGLLACERLWGWGPLTVAAVTGRGGTGGLIGNEGQLGLVLAFAGSTALVPVLTAVAWRGAWMVLYAWLLIGVGASGTVTALLGLLAGSGAVLIGYFGRRAVWPLLGGGVVAMLVVGSVGPLRARGAELLRHAQRGAWDDVVSNRAGPWAAALEMVRARPWSGVGPGAYEAEFVPYRLAAEVRYGRRFVTQTVTSSFAQAHSEPLQAMAEWGLPAAGTVLATVLLLWGALCVRAVGSRDPELLGLVAVITVALVAALTWFPFRQASTVLPVLLSLGRGWRRLA